MSIPTNLLSVNNSQINSLTGEITQQTLTVDVTPEVLSTEVKNRLLTSVPTMVSMTGSITAESTEMFENYSNLDTVIPDSLFQGTAEQVELLTTTAIKAYLTSLPSIPAIPSITSLLPTLPNITVPRLSYGQIKDFVERKKDEVLARRQQAFTESQKSLVEESRDGFSFRRNITNKTSLNLSNVLSRQE